jgi:hypothetical protein
MHGKDTSTIKILKCNDAVLPVCQGAQYQVAFYRTETEIGVKIKSPAGIVTRLTKCQTCGDNNWDWESGPMKQALIKDYGQGVLLFLSPPRYDRQP